MTWKITKKHARAYASTPTSTPPAGTSPEPRLPSQNAPKRNSRINIAKIDPRKPDNVPGFDKSANIPGLDSSLRGNYQGLIPNNRPVIDHAPSRENRSNVVGFRPGPAPALGRPADLPKGHGAWKNDSCFSQGSKSWKPDILSIGDAHNCPGHKGPQSPSRPPNVSGNKYGYNTKLFKDDDDVINSLQYIGYKIDNTVSMISRFQRHWNFVISKISYSPESYRDIRFIYIPTGNLKVDGYIGPHTLNALEIAMINQSKSEPWPEVIEIVNNIKSGYGKNRIYNAAEGT